MWREKDKSKSASSSTDHRSGKPTGQTHFAYGPFKGEQYGHVAASRDKKHVDWIDTIIDIAKEKRAKYQEEFVQYLIECGKVVEEKGEFVSAGTAATAEIEERRAVATRTTENDGINERIRSRKTKGIKEGWS